ncbi:SCO family protein [uncultured Dokdonia sp.]|uniref:SCO family protein n=1 Tax=uncultured Dokdonia sp. TaxID=575653 RepID=UPI00260F026F|nr:SCO family protein [uncultured Dokdonia sp.]
MLRFFERYKVFAIVMTVLSIIIITIIYNLLKVPKKLPIYQPEMVDSTLVDSTIQYVKKYHKIAPFQLINQNGDTITQEDYKNKIYVADFFFTTCQTICPIMTDHMVQIQKELKEDSDVLLLSHSVIPEYDTPKILKEYAIKKGVDDTRWNLVTGSRKEIYTLARKSYLAVKNIPGEEDAMVHTENFMLIDKKSQIRGYYDGTDPKEIERLLEEIEILKLEYED